MKQFPQMLYELRVSILPVKRDMRPPYGTFYRLKRI